MDATAFHTIIQLVKKGIFDLDDIEAIADRLDEEGKPDAAHAVRAAIFEAQIEPETEPPVSLRLVANNPDGGNGTV